MQHMRLLGILTQLTLGESMIFRQGRERFTSFARWWGRFSTLPNSSFVGIAPSSHKFDKMIESWKLLTLLYLPLPIDISSFISLPKKRVYTKLAQNINIRISLEYDSQWNKISSIMSYEIFQRAIFRTSIQSLNITRNILQGIIILIKNGSPSSVIMGSLRIERNFVYQ